MLRTDFIDLLNSGQAWAFLGSGVSADSGYPSWKGLVDKVVINLDADARAKVEHDRLFKSALESGAYDKCFGHIERYVSRNRLEDIVRTELRVKRNPGALIRILADWPFAGYITTNYDVLLENELKQIGERDWLSIGNSEDEARKISGDPSHVVWHIHGSVDLPLDKSRLVLNEADYDELYLNDSPMLAQLKALLAQRRVVFVGFGFKDLEVSRLLKTVGRLGNPAKPAFVFFQDRGDAESHSEKKQLLDRYNIDSIAYHAESDTHEQLPKVLQTYDSFILRRTLQFGQASRPCPSYDPETTGLLLYNSLVLGPGSHMANDVVGTLLRTRIMSLLKHRGRATVQLLIEDVSERVAAIQGQQPAAPTIEQQVTQALDELRKSNRVELSTNSAGIRGAILTPEGNELVATQAATAERLSEQFTTSLRSRAQELAPNSGEVARRVAETVEVFLKDCITKRALGVAMILGAAELQYQKYHMVALIAGAS